jgi:hypothetical protein
MFEAHHSWLIAALCREWARVPKMYTSNIWVCYNVLVHQRKDKIRHGGLILMVLNSVTDLASQMARLTVRKVRHGSITGRSKPKAQRARTIVTDLHLVGRSPVPDRCVRPMIGPLLRSGDIVLSPSIFPAMRWLAPQRTRGSICSEVN